MSDRPLDVLDDEIRLIEGQRIAAVTDNIMAATNLASLN